MRNPGVDSAVNDLKDRVAELREDQTSQQAQEAVCLATRYALSLFLPVWLDSGGDYASDVVQIFRKALKEAMELLPDRSPYRQSVGDRQTDLEEFVAGRRFSLA